MGSRELISLKPQRKANTMQHDNKPIDAESLKCDGPSRMESANFIPQIYRQSGMPITNLRVNGEEGKSYSEGLWDVAATLPNGKEMKFEVEQKDDDFWSPFPFRYPTMNSPDRKRNSNADFLLLYNSSYNRAWLTSKKTAVSYPSIMKKCKNYSKPEPFLDVPIEKGKFFKKVNGVWQEDKLANEMVKPTVQG